MILNYGAPYLPVGRNALKYICLTLFFLVTHQVLEADPIKGTVHSDDGTPISYANVVLYSAKDSTMVKVSTSDDDGVFNFDLIPPGEYYVEVSYIGYEDQSLGPVKLLPDEIHDLGQIVMSESSVTLETAVVTATRPLVIVESDKTIFNIEGTINSAGDDALNLLRKAPGVLIDNSSNISLMGRTGVAVYVEGKPLPMSGEELGNYLAGLNSDQIDRIEIISNPGPKYEAQGTGGVIDIRLKKNENHGSNFSLNTSATRAYLWRGGAALDGNFRNERFNVFGRFDYNNRATQRFINSDDYIGNARLLVMDTIISHDEIGTVRLGTDFYLSDHHTIGFVASASLRNRSSELSSETMISSVASSSQVDSLLFAKSNSVTDFENPIFNINYRYEKDGHSLSVDLDQLKYLTDNTQLQPSVYSKPDGTLLVSKIADFYQPIEINISSIKFDYETKLLGGKLAVGSKVGRVSTDNTFLFYEVINGDKIRDDNISNLFYYTEKVYAGYMNYQRSINEKLMISTGLRIEQTDAEGELVAFLPSLQEPPVKLDYLSFFPNARISYNPKSDFGYSLNYSRRINRPDYSVLNPLRLQVSDIFFTTGNPNLKPEINDNIELGLTYKKKYSLRVNYSRTKDQITRLWGPDGSDELTRTMFYDNLREQNLYGANLSFAQTFTPKWNAHFTFNGNYTDNQADYGDGNIIDIQALSYFMNQQHTIQLPIGLTGEISGWYSGPGIWGGAFKYDATWAINLGLQKKFLNNRLTARISAQDIFRQANWSGVIENNGLLSNISGDNDSRSIGVNVNYKFGNSKAGHQNRASGIDSERRRLDS